MILKIVSSNLMKNPKAKGARQERRVIKILETAGYYCVKTGGSLGMWDILAFNSNTMRLIQVKSNYCRPAEREGLELFKAPSFCSKELWIFKDYAKHPTITIL